MELATIESVLLSLLVLDAIALTVLILMQQGRGADVGAAFGSGSSNTMFGGSGSTSFMTKVVVWLAIGFFVIAFGLAYTAKERAGSVSRTGLPDVPALQDDLELPEDVPELTTGSEGVDSDVPEI